MSCLGDFGSYLGIPFSHSNKRTHLFKHLLQKLSQKLESWKKSHLSKASRLTMIKVTLQALPLHLMSCVKVLQTIYNLLDMGNRKFFWGGNQTSKKVHWINWDTLCQQKLKSGLGLRKNSFFNKALLAKYGWNFIISPQSLLARLFKELYFPNTFFLDAKKGSKSSPFWRSSLWGRGILSMGIGWKVGNGNNINLMKDNWIPGTTFF